MAASADYLSAGSEVRAAGVVVGKVLSAQPTRTGQARLVLEIDDPTAWPIPRSTHVQFRWASTIAFTNRYVELDFPSGRAASGPVIPGGGTIPADQVTPTVEARPAVRHVRHEHPGQPRSALRRGRAGAGERRPGPAGGARLLAARADSGQPPALRGLGGDPQALSQLVASTDTVVHAIQASNPGVGQFVTGASRTFAAVGSQASQLQTLLAETPPALDTARATLAHASRTLIAATRLLTGLAPGIDQLRAVAAPLNGTLQSLVKIGPDAQQTLNAVRAAVPYLNPLLTKATALMPRTRIDREPGRHRAGLHQAVLPGDRRLRHHVDRARRPERRSRQVLPRQRVRLCAAGVRGAADQRTVPEAVPRQADLCLPAPAGIQLGPALVQQRLWRSGATRSTPPTTRWR